MIHKFSMGGLNLVLDVSSGSIHCMDSLAFRILDALEEQSTPNISDEGALEAVTYSLGEEFHKEKIEEAFLEIKALFDKGLIFSEENNSISPDSFKNRGTVIKALCLNISHACNMKCSYCFAGYSEVGENRPSALMPFSVGKAAIDFLVASSGKRKNLEVDFFGGEPLINFQLVKDVIDYARSLEAAHGKRFRFTLTTNGILLDQEKMDYINENLQNVVLSIDGRKSVNDNMRKKLNNEGTYENIVPKFLEMAKLREQNNYYVRGTYTAENLDFSQDVLHLADLGFKQISVEPVVTDENAPFALNESHIDELCKEYERLALEMSNRDDSFNFFHFNIDLTGGPCIIKRLSGCGAGCEYLAVAPSGDIYPCHQFVDTKEFLMGNVLDSGLVNYALKDEFAQNNIFAKEQCNDCFAKYFCSGGCHANSYFTGGNINATYEVGCQLMKKRVECAIFLKAAASMKD